MSQYWKGKKHSEETKMKMSQSLLKRAARGDKHYLWKGDDVKYHGLHLWIRRNLPKSKTCQFCDQERKLEAACVTGIYNREFRNWKYLCRSCHEKFDVANGMRKTR